MGKRAFPPLPTRPQLVLAVYPALFPLQLQVCHVLKSLRIRAQESKPKYTSAKGKYCLEGWLGSTIGTNAGNLKTEEKPFIFRVFDRDGTDLISWELVPVAPDFISVLFLAIFVTVDR